MSAEPLDARGFITARMELIRDLVGDYVAGGHDLDAMREMIAFVVSNLAERTLTAELTNNTHVHLGDCTLTLDEAHARIAGLRSLPVI